MTKYEQEILNIINNSNSHLSAEDIFLLLKQQKKKIVLASVYNNLSKLCDNGLIRKITMEDSPNLYDKIKRHDHLICIKCGKISDIYFQDLTNLIQNQTNISISSYDLRINYICEECQKKENNNEKMEM